MLINPATTRPSDVTPNLPAPSVKESSPPSPGDLPALETEDLRLASTAAETDSLDGTSALAALDFARRSIESNPAAAVSVQANARPESVFELIREAAIAGA